MLDLLLARPLVGQFVRFIGIGFLNTAVDFAVLNLIASATGIYTGIGVGIINTISFGIAVTHSYWWNKYWAFGGQHGKESAGKSLGQFITAAILGGGIIALVVFGAGLEYGFGYFVLLLAALAVGEVFLWKFFKLQKDSAQQKSSREFALFVSITLVGLGINTGILIFVTQAFPPQFGFSQDLWTNLIKAGATVVSLVWNFTGYKLIVFRKK